MSRRRRPAKDRLRSPISIAGIQEWDHSLAVGDLVSLDRDYPAVHVYRIVSSTVRRIYPEDLFNYPSLKENKKRSMDEYCPLMTLRMYRPAPTWAIIGPPPKEKIVDGFLVTRVTAEDLDIVLRNLTGLIKEIEDV